MGCEGAVKHGFNCTFAGPVPRFRGACSAELLWFHLCQLLVVLCRSSTNKLRSGGSGDKRFLSEAKAVLWGSGGHQPPPSGDVSCWHCCWLTAHDGSQKVQGPILDILVTMLLWSIKTHNAGLISIFLFICCEICR